MSEKSRPDNQDGIMSNKLILHRNRIFIYYVFKILVRTAVADLNVPLESQTNHPDQGLSIDHRLIVLYINVKVTTISSAYEAFYILQIG